MMESLREGGGGVVEDFAAGTLTVEKYLEQWLSSAKGSLSPRTYANYVHHVDHHIVPALGRVKLGRLTSLQVQGLYDAKRDEGLSAGTVRYIHAILHRALRQAQLRWKLIGRNPADDVELPRVSQRKSSTLSMEQVELFLAVARRSRDRHEALYHVAFFCGLRIGEILGLGWEHVDLANRELHVRRQLQRMRDGSGLVFVQPKQDEQRTVALGERTAAALEAHRLRQAEERRAAPGYYEDHDLVFATTKGTPLEAGNVVRRSFKPLLGEAGLPNVPFHSTRHTCATIMLSRGVDARTVQEVLGHKDVATTLRFYSHVLPNMRRRAASVFDQGLELGAEPGARDGAL
jgi:integrase